MTKDIKSSVKNSLKRRYLFEGVFKFLGFSAVTIAISALCFLLYSLVADSLGAFWQTNIQLNLTYPTKLEVRVDEVVIIDEQGKPKLDENGNINFTYARKELEGIDFQLKNQRTAIYDLTKLSDSEYKKVVAASIDSQYEDILYQGLADAIGEESIKGRKFRDIRKFVNLAATEKAKNYLKNNRDAAGNSTPVYVPSHYVFDYWWRHGGQTIEKDLQELDNKISNVNAEDETSKEVLKELSIERAKLLKGMSEKQVDWAIQLANEDLIDVKFTTRVLTNLDSSEADVAGLRGAIVGTLYTMLITLLISVTFGISAAIWLEQFAPKGSLSDFIEVNINNMAAVPSIVKGILGLVIAGAIYKLFGLNTMGTPLLGGIVLSLIAMPTIIVSSRAAIKSVPPSLKQGALGVGASNLQAVFGHVVPAALPGILTGVIIGLAQALGETAPLLMIGMKSFIRTVPQNALEPATTLSATIYNWFSFGKDSFNEITSAAILILLVFLLLMNILAVYLRKKFELDW